jgi:hypothetical protein
MNGSFFRPGAVVQPGIEDFGKTAKGGNIDNIERRVSHSPAFRSSKCGSRSRTGAFLPSEV